MAWLREVNHHCCLNKCLFHVVMARENGVEADAMWRAFGRNYTSSRVQYALITAHTLGTDLLDPDEFTVMLRSHIPLVLHYRHLPSGFVPDA